MFQSSYFTFDNIKSSDMGVVLITLDDSNLIQHGLSFSEEPLFDFAINSKEAYYYGSKISEPEAIELHISLVDEVDNPMKWTIKDRIRVFDWLVKEDFCPFTTEDEPDIVYYLKCVGIKKEFSPNLEGVITLTMQPSSQYAYTPILKQSHCNYDGEPYVMEVSNISNVSSSYYPQFTITNLEEGQEIAIKNKKTNKEFIVKNLPVNEAITVDMETRQLLTSLNTPFDLSNTNKEWLYLVKGTNDIEIKGKCDLTIKCQFPLIV